MFENDIWVDFLYGNVGIKLANRRKKLSENSHVMFGWGREKVSYLLSFIHINIVIVQECHIACF